MVVTFWYSTVSVLITTTVISFTPGVGLAQPTTPYELLSGVSGVCHERTKALEAGGTYESVDNMVGQASIQWAEAQGYNEYETQQFVSFVFTSTKAMCPETYE